MDNTGLRIQEVQNEKQLGQFILFPWQVYRGDRNWVPPLISRRRSYLDRAVSPVFRDRDAALFLALRRNRVVGTVGASISNYDNDYRKEKAGHFGFFETVDDYEVARLLFDTARQWLRERGMTVMRGPYNFGGDDDPGFLVGGEDCPPVMLEAHTKPYYAVMAERYGMVKYTEGYAYRIDRPVRGDLPRATNGGTEYQESAIPPKIIRVAEWVQKRAGVTVRRARLDHWDEEIAIARRLFNAALMHLRDHVPMSEEQFRSMALEMKDLLHEDLVYFAEVSGEPIAFSLAIPDVNRVLIHGNGGRYPWDWLRMWWYSKRIDVVSFKIMVMLPQYHGRGLDAILYLNTARAALARGYSWMDMSLVAEENTAVRLLAEKVGGRIFKRYRIYQINV
jgi:GNAT superfamily N-acetyltransferase